MGRLLATLWSVLPFRQLALIAAVTVLVLIGISFARITLANDQMQLQKQQAQSTVESLKSENQALQTQVAVLSTDAAVEGLARKELGWTKPGDTAVILVAPTVVSAAPAGTRVARP